MRAPPFSCPAVFVSDLIPPAGEPLSKPATSLVVCTVSHTPLAGAMPLFHLCSSHFFPSRGRTPPPASSSPCHTQGHNDMRLAQMSRAGASRYTSHTLSSSVTLLISGRFVALRNYSITNLPQSVNPKTAFSTPASVVARFNKRVYNEDNFLIHFSVLLILRVAYAADRIKTEV